MGNNLNQNLYSRFGLQLDLQRVQDGCKKYFKEVIINELKPLTVPNLYKDSEQLWRVHFIVLKEVCRQLFLDSKQYGDDYSSGLKRLIELEMSYPFVRSFDEYLFRLQVLINVIYENSSIKQELNSLASEMNKYFNDYPILGITIKIYKHRAPQILPTTSRKFEQEIKNTLGLLETDKKYKDTLAHFENGLKEFLTAKIQAHYKDVIEDMYTACDDLVKVILGNNGKGFKHISDKIDATTLGLNGHQKELYKNLRVWMDEIKHGTLKNFDRNDTEMIISITGSLIRFVISKHESKP